MFFAKCISLLLAGMLLSGCVSAEMEKFDEANEIKWIKTEKVRATYTWAFYHKNARLVVKDLDDTGFNSIFLKAKSSSSNLEEWLDEADKRGLRVFMCHNFWSLNDRNEEAEKKYRKIVYKTGIIGKAPCPLNYDYWRECILPEELTVANLSLKHQSIVGLLMDTEMYGVKPHAFLNDVCFCDDCFRRFIECEKIGDGKSEDRKSRYKWLVEKKLLEEYYGFLQKGIKECVSKYASEIHKVNSKLILGNLNFVDTWYFNGLIQGYASQDVPALVAPESPSYNDGYTPETERLKKKFKARKFNVILVPGIWDKSFFPDDLAVNTYQLAMHTDGYFDFTIRALYGLIEPFNKDLLRKSGGDLKNYWNAFKLANEEIVAKCRSGAKHKSVLDEKPENLAAGCKVLDSNAEVMKNLALCAKVVSCYPEQRSPTEVDTVLKEDLGYRRALAFDVSKKTREARVVIDLGKVVDVGFVQALCQGGGLKGGTYLPKSMRVAVLPEREAIVGGVSENWIQVGVADSPDKRMAFSENGCHSPSAYSRWLGVQFPKIVRTRYLALEFTGISDAAAAKLTKIGENKSKLVKIRKIEIYPLNKPLLDPAELKKLTDGDSSYAKSATFGVGGKNNSVSFVLDLGCVRKISKTKALCQGGGLKGGVYYPKTMKVSVLQSGADLADTVTGKGAWLPVGTAVEPDNEMAFAENGHHSPNGYSRWITAVFKAPTETRYVKFEFAKIADSKAAELTKTGERKAKVIKVREIEVYSPVEKR